jgi:mono/diheme cytochrome c family protein
MIRNMIQNTLCVILVLPVFYVAVVEGLSSPSMRALASQAPGSQSETVWDGVYTSEQAARGKVVYEQNCADCHSTGEAPTLFGGTFMRRWFEDSLNSVYTKMRSQMPLNTPGSLPEAAYLDILSFVLAENGFPAGAEPLTSNAQRLTGILVTEKGGAGAPVPNFSLVQVVGCLTQSANKAWLLINSSDPVRATEPGESAPADLKTSESKPLGAGTVRLLDYPALGREARKNHKVQVKGFLIRQPNSEDRINPTALQTLAESCAP